MIRLLLLGSVVCAATLGGAHLSKSLTPPVAPIDGSAARLDGSLELVQTELLAANRVLDERVSGYFLASFALALNPGARNDYLPPIELVLVDGFQQLVAADPMFDFSQSSAIDVERLSDGLRDLVNRRVGSNAIHSVFVTQVDYLRQNETRTNSAARRATIRGEVNGAAVSKTLNKDR